MRGGDIADPPVEIIVPGDEDTARWNQDTMKKEETESQGILAAAGYTLTNAKPAEIARAVDAGVLPTRLPEPLGRAAADRVRRVGGRSGLHGEAA